jgi:hypothetical protein
VTSGGTVDYERLPNPEKLREIAYYLDALTRTILPTWRAAVSTDPSARAVVADLERTEMQDDLRRWADYLEELNGSH